MKPAVGSWAQPHELIMFGANALHHHLAVDPKLTSIANCRAAVSRVQNALRLLLTSRTHRLFLSKQDCCCGDQALSAGVGSSVPGNISRNQRSTSTADALRPSTDDVSAVPMINPKTGARFPGRPLRSSFRRMVRNGSLRVRSNPLRRQHQPRLKACRYQQHRLRYVPMFRGRGCRVYRAANRFRSRLRYRP